MSHVYHVRFYVSPEREDLLQSRLSEAISGDWMLMSKVGFNFDSSGKKPDSAREHVAKQAKEARERGIPVQDPRWFDVYLSDNGDRREEGLITLYAPGSVLESTESFDREVLDFVRERVKLSKKYDHN